ncbi:MAG TPA: MBL fold metallo-hydrolase [Thermoplasmata archaeon]|jgi:ribonuclease BN (tRNA processing enzyme)|nr:MBL fold metallo-hydrolase [Thermoplasmata archaeon]HIH28167.1 MBL fold metallo-hydrolase [Thermoplasmata archaeon]
MNTIKFLGTAGARFVVMKQLRASGGIWLTLEGTHVLIDPGPGALLRCLSSRPKLDPQDLEGIILTHKHLDHSNDINIMIEAMTNGGFKKKGMVFAPQDALHGDPVILQYVREQVNHIEILREKGSYKIGNISFETPKQLKHGVETYGLNIKGKNTRISLITDTDYFPELASFFTGDILIINVVMFEDINTIEHLSLNEAELIIKENKPRLAILTHFGMGMVKAKPWEIAENLTKKLKIQVLAAQDGMQVDIDQYTA